MRYPLSRRQFCTGLAGLVAAPYLAPARTARAQTTGPKRCLIVFHPDGTVHNYWRPQNPQDPTSSPILTPLAPHRDRLAVLGGMNFNIGGSHENGMAHTLTGGQATSVDQVLADALGSQTPFPSLELGVQAARGGASVQNRVCYRDGDYVHPDDDPKSVYTRLFGVLNEDEDPVAQLNRKRSILDRAMQDLTRANGCLGSDERYKLSGALDAFRTIERRLADSASMQNTGGAMCTSPALALPDDHRGSSQFPDVVDAMTSLAAMALACGQTRVLTLQLSHTVSPLSMTWAGSTEGHHSLSHANDGSPGVEQFAQNEIWYAGQFGALLDKLASFPDPDGDGTLLDGTLVFWIKELADSRLHNFQGVPCVLAGGAGSGINPGRYIDLGGIEHQRVLQTVCHLMGVSDAPFSTDIVSEVLA